MKRTLLILTLACAAVSVLANTMRASMKEQCKTNYCDLRAEAATDEHRLLCNNACLAAVDSCLGDCNARKQLDADCLAPCLASATKEYEELHGEEGDELVMAEKVMDARSLLEVFQQDYQESPLYSSVYSALDAGSKAEIDAVLSSGKAALFVPMDDEAFAYSKLYKQLPQDAAKRKRAMQVHVAAEALDLTQALEGHNVDLKHQDQSVDRPHVYLGHGHLAAYADVEFDAQITTVIESEQGGILYVVDSVLAHPVISGVAPLSKAPRNLPVDDAPQHEEEQGGSNGSGEGEEEHQEEEGEEEEEGGNKLTGHHPRAMFRPSNDESSCAAAPQQGDGDEPPQQQAPGGSCSA